MDKIRALNVFKRIVELGSFQAAAKDLKLSKAAITKNMSELERALDTPLINRTTRKLFITQSGLEYYREVCLALDTLKNAEQTLFFNRNHTAGKLKVGMPLSLGIEFINKLICDFSTLFPSVSIEIVMSDKYEDLIANGIDVTIRGGGVLADSSFKSRQLCDLRRMLCASPNYVESHPQLLNPQDLKVHNCLSYSLASSRKWRFRRGQEIVELEISPSNYSVNNSLALVQACIYGKGIILTPYIYVKPKLKSGELVELLSDWIPEEQHYLYAVYPSSKTNSKLVRSFIDFLIENLSFD